MEKYYLKKKKKISNKELLITTFLAHGGSNVISKFFVAPLERVTLIKQTEPHLFRSVFIAPSFSYKNIIQSILANQGYKSFWWGYQTRALNFLCFTFFRLLFHEKLQQKIKTKDNKKSSSTFFFYLYISSCLAATITYPLDVAQAYLTLNFERTKHKKKYSRGVFLFIYDQITKRTIGNLYCGYSLCLLNFFPYLYIISKLEPFFTKHFIEFQIKEASQNENNGEHNLHDSDKKTTSGDGRHNNLNEEYKQLFNKSPEIYLYIFGGVLAGYIAQTLTFPIETIRRTYQYKKILEQNYQNHIISYKKLQKKSSPIFPNNSNSKNYNSIILNNMEKKKAKIPTFFFFSSISTYYRGFLLHSLKLIPEYIVFSCFFYYVKNNMPV